MAEPSAIALDVLAQAVSGRLWAVAPEGTSPNVSARNVGCQLGVVNGLENLEDNLFSVSVNTPNDAQDRIVRDPEEGWPRTVDGVPGEGDPGKDLPEAEAAVIYGELRLWYGDARRPTLELRPGPAGLGTTV